MRTWPAIDIVLAESESPDLLQAFLLDYDLAAIEELTPTTLRYFFRTVNARDTALPKLASAFSRAAPRSVDVPDEDWVARSQAGLRAVRVGRLTVAPPWDAGDPSPETLVIRPAMGFGTGHHATTRLCLHALQALDVSGRVLDVGTGSGVLAIAASRLGANRVYGVDDDPDALDAARDNMTLNPGTTVEFVVADFRSLTLAPVDLLLANLTGALLVSSASMLARLVLPTGRLVLSGFSVDDTDEVVAAFRNRVVERRSSEEEWAAVTLYTSAT